MKSIPKETKYFWSTVLFAITFYFAFRFGSQGIAVTSFFVYLAVLGAIRGREVTWREQVNVVGLVFLFGLIYVNYVGPLLNTMSMCRYDTELTYQQCLDATDMEIKKAAFCKKYDPTIPVLECIATPGSELFWPGF